MVRVRIRLSDHGCGHGAARFRIESVTREKSVGPLASSPRIRHASQRPDVALHQPAGSLGVGDGHAVGACCSVPFIEDRGDRRAIDPPYRQLLPERPLPAWVGAIPGFDPGAREGLVIEDGEVEEPADRALDEVLPVARAQEAAADLGG